MAKIVIWFYVGVFFLEMNLMAACSLVNPNWLVRGFGSVQILAGAVAVDFSGLLGLAAWLLTPKKPKPREPLDLRKTFEYWKPSHFIDGPYPTAGEFFNAVLFNGFLLAFTSLPFGILWVWCGAPLPLFLREIIAINSLLCATGPLLFSAWGGEYFAMLIVRRLRWRGPPMDQKQLDAWKAANPGAPMPWERGRRGSKAKKDSSDGKSEMPGDEV